MSRRGTRPWRSVLVALLVLPLTTVGVTALAGSPAGAATGTYSLAITSPTDGSTTPIGTTFSYVVSATCAGSCGGVVVDQTLPSGLVLDGSGVATGPDQAVASVTENAGQLAFSLNDFSGDTSFTVSVLASANDASPSTTYPLRVSSNTPDGTVTSPVVTVRPTGASTLSSTMTVSTPDPEDPRTVTWTVASCDGPTGGGAFPIEAFALTDPLPAGAQVESTQVLTSASGSPNAVWTADGQTYTLTAAPGVVLTPGVCGQIRAAITVTYPATSFPGGGPGITNTATTTGALLDGTPAAGRSVSATAPGFAGAGPPPPPAVPTDHSPVTLVAEASADGSGFAPAATVASPSTVQLRLVATNPRPTPVSDGTICDVLPSADGSAFALTATGAVAGLPPGAVVAYSDDPGRSDCVGGRWSGAVPDGGATAIRVTGVTLTAHGSLALTFAATVPADQPGGATVGNQASFTGTSGATALGPLVSNTASVAVGVTTGLVLDAAINGATFSSAPGDQVAKGATLVRTYQVTNTGNTTVSSLRVTDDTLPATAGVQCASTSLPPGAATDCSAPDGTALAGQVAGTATVTGSAAGATGGSSIAVTSTPVTSYYFGQSPAVGLATTANVASVSATGTTIRYTFTVTDTGNTPLDHVGLTDALPGLSSFDCGPVDNGSLSLEPTASTTCTAEYATTQADIDRGGIDNPAAVVATSPLGVTVTDQAALHLPVNQVASLALGVVPTPATVTAAGATVTYDFDLTNTGTVTLHALSVANAFSGASSGDQLGAVTCPAGSLAPGHGATCTATVTTAQADVDAGGITGSVTAGALTPAGAAVTSSPATGRVTIPATPGLAVTASADPVDFASSGTTVTYRATVTNTGNVTLGQVAVTGPRPGRSTFSCPVPTLAPNAAETCTASYTTTAADVAAGSVTIAVTATGLAPSGVAVQATATMTLPATGSLSIVATANPRSVTGAGSPVTYSFVVANTSQVTLSAVGVAGTLGGASVTDSALGPPVSTDVRLTGLVVWPFAAGNLGRVTCSSTTLAPKASTTCNASPYLVTQAQTDSGGLAASFTAQGTTPTGALVTSSPSTADVTIPAAPGIRLVGSADVTSVGAADTTITYTYAVTNTGNVTLSPVTVADPMHRLSPLSCPETSLAPDVAERCTATYTTTEADLEAGSIGNTGTVESAAPSGPTVRATSTVTVLVSAVQGGPVSALAVGATGRGYSASTGTDIPFHGPLMTVVSGLTALVLVFLVLAMAVLGRRRRQASRD